MAEPDPKPDPTPEPKPDPPEPDDPLAGLDDRARRIVESANSEAAARRHDLQEAREALAEREREIADYRKAQESEQEKLVREAEERGAAQRDSELAPRLLEADLAIAAAGRLRDPQDAVGLLSSKDREELLGIEDTPARRARADELIGELIEAKPYLALAESNDRQGPLVTQGARTGDTPSRVAKDPDTWLRGRTKR